VSRRRRRRSAWRWRCAALGFATFGLISGTLGIVIVPLARLAARCAGSRAGGAARAVRDPPRHALWVRDRERCGVIARVACAASRRCADPVVVVANHPVADRHADPAHPDAAGRSDRECAWGDNPVLRGCVDGAEYLRVEQGAVMVRHAIERLHAGRTLVVYPEGSRTPIEGLRTFERGAAQIALLARCDIVPVVITVQPRTLMKGQAFADVPATCAEWTVEVGQPIHPADHVREGESMSAASRRVTAVLQEYFEKRWDRGIC
jgi:hypothetical protein